MFAACPNFNDFYTEDAVNNNGLECIRFLNEILSDYDDLLTDTRFQTITKIKTVGSTYMLASGLNTERNITKVLTLLSFLSGYVLVQNERSNYKSFHLYFCKCE